jgi:HSP20 family protein
MLERYDPLARNLQLMQDIMRNVFGDARMGLDASRGTTWLPAVDVYEDHERLIFKFDLPEVRREDLSVRLENGVLTVEGKRGLEFEDRRDNYHRVERVFGSFARSFSVPNTVATDKIDAELKNGVLRVTLVKKPEAQPRSIEIRE